MTMDIPDWLSFFSFSWLIRQGFILFPHPMSMFHWYDKVFPVQPYERGIPWFIQLYLCQSVNADILWHVMCGMPWCSAWWILKSLAYTIKRSTFIQVPPESFQVKRPNGRAGTVSDLHHSLIIYLFQQE